MQTTKLAQALGRRKELSQKVEQLRVFRDNKQLFHPIVERRRAHEGVDDIIGQVPKLTASQVTAEYDHYASQLRRLDAYIQQANWETEVSIDDDLYCNYTEVVDK